MNFKENLMPLIQFSLTWADPFRVLPHVQRTEGEREKAECQKQVVNELQQRLGYVGRKPEPLVRTAYN